MKRIVFIILAAVLVVTGCRKNIELPMQVLRTSVDEIVAPKFGADYSLAIETNTAWKVVMKDLSWASTDIDQNVGASVLVLTVTPNDGEVREGMMTVVSMDGEISIDIPVRQGAASDNDYLPVRLVRGLEREDGFTFPMGKLKGYVVAGQKEGNYPEGYIAIVDNFTDPKSGITICSDKPIEAKIGSEVEVDLEGAVLRRSGEGVLALNVKQAPKLTDATPISPNAVAVSYGQLASGDFESMFVALDKYQPTEEYVGAVFSQNPFIENKERQQARIRVGSKCKFAQSSFKPGAGSLCAVAGALESGVPVVYPQAEADVEFGTFRFGVLPGIKKLPYVFSFYCTSQTNGDTKYIDYTEVRWQPATKMLKGEIARDKDVNVGAFLEMAAYANDISATVDGKGVSNMWAEAGAHDNVNSSGFVSPDGKTTPTSECGWWLTVPLQMDMPQTFNVFFGLCLNEWSISTWALSYSYDKESWTRAGEVKVKRWSTGGSYYYYFCVPVTTTVPFTSDSNLYLKLTPFGTSAGNPNNDGTADGHGKSTFIRLHSSIIISDPAIPATPVPDGAVYFEPFDRLTDGADFFIGDKLAGMANYCGSDFASWTTLQKNGMIGTNVRQRPGYAQIGYVNDEDTGSRKEMTNEVGSLTTPAFGKAGDFTLSFKAGAYRTPAIRPNAATTTPDVASPDIDEAVIIINNGGTIDGATKVAVKNLPVDFTNKEYKFDIKGATAATTITFTSEVAAGQFSRWFIDEILVK